MGEEKETADLHDGGCLRELQRLLDGGVHGLVPALPQRQDRVVQHLRPATPPDQRNTKSKPRHGQRSKRRKIHAEPKKNRGARSKGKGNGPSEEDDPVVDGEVEPPQRRADARHRRSRGEEGEDAGTGLGGLGYSDQAPELCYY